MRTELAIKREYSRSNRAFANLRRNLDPSATAELRGARQALAWVLEDNAMAPVKCVVPFKRKRMRKAKREQ